MSDPQMENDGALDDDFDIDVVVPPCLTRHVTDAEVIQALKQSPFEQGMNDPANRMVKIGDPLRLD